MTSNLPCRFISQSVEDELTMIITNTFFLTFGKLYSEFESCSWLDFYCSCSCISPVFRMKRAEWKKSLRTQTSCNTWPGLRNIRNVTEFLKTSIKRQETFTCSENTTIKKISRVSLYSYKCNSETTDWAPCKSFVVAMYLKHSPFQLQKSALLLSDTICTSVWTKHLFSKVLAQWHVLTLSLAHWGLVLFLLSFL